MARFLKKQSPTEIKPFGSLQIPVKTIEPFHDQLNIYHTNVANRLNEMFRVFTIFSIIFVPLTFIAGIHGMNFEVMPEYSHLYEYFTVWAVMTIIAIIMLFYFRRKGMVVIILYFNHSL